MAGPDDRTRRKDLRPQWRPHGLVADAHVEPAPAPDPGVDPWLGKVFDARFEILERIGQGGMATVYRARERGLIERDVAIKLLSPESSQNVAIVARFRKEAQLIADIHHPHVVNLHHVGRAHDQLYIAMELLRGHNLLELLRNVRVLPWSRLAPMMLHVCAALQAAHDHKVIHRDVKPSNCFLLDAAGNPDFVKLLDFGIAKAELVPGAATGTDDPLTQQGMFVGTPHYAAPEIIDRQPGVPVDGRVDQFAVGVVMYQCLTGTLPFAGASRVEALYSTVHCRPPPLRERAGGRDIPAAAESLVMRALALRPEDRHADMTSLAAAIRDASGPRAHMSSRSVLVGVIEDVPALDPRAPKTHPSMPSLPVQDTTPHSQPSIEPTVFVPHTLPPVDELPAADDRRPFIATLMVLALGSLVMLFMMLREVWSEDLPADKQMQLQPWPGVESPPAPSIDETTTDASTTAVDTTTTTDAAPLVIEEVDDDDSAVRRRHRAIDVELGHLPLTDIVLGCHISVAQRWQLPITFVVLANGTAVELTVTEPATTGLGPRERNCLLDAVRRRHFPRGPVALTHSYTLKTTR